MAAVLVGGVLVFTSMREVSSSGEIFPGVSIGGVDVGGLTADEARAKLNAELDLDYSGEQLALSFGSDNYVIRAEDISVKIDVDSAVETAVSFGRGGNLLENYKNYLRSEAGAGVDIALSCSLDEQRLRSYVQSVALDINSSGSESGYSVEDGKLVVLKGAGAVSVDTDALFEQIVAAFEERELAPLDISVNIDEGKTVDVAELYKLICVEGADAYFDESWNIVEGVTGVSFDLEAAQDAFDRAVRGEEIEIPLIYTEPMMTAEQLESMLFRDELYTKTTYLTNDYNRNNNISLASASINGLVMYPGDTFSYNETVGQRTTARGYLPAGAYVAGEVVSEVGGGICQVSSTLYYAVLHCNMEIVERNYHQFAVSYLPLGLDAAVNWGTQDLKFKNNLEYPIRLDLEVADGGITVTIVGTKTEDWIDVAMEYAVSSTTPFNTIEKVDESMEPGKTKVDVTGSTGYVVDSYRCLYDSEGNLLSREHEAHSVYSKRDKVVLIAYEDSDEYIPPEEPAPEPAPEPEQPAPQEPETPGTTEPEPPEPDTPVSGEGENPGEEPTPEQPAEGETEGTPAPEPGTEPEQTEPGTENGAETGTEG